MQIIPAIDIIEGKAVRLSGGDYDNKTVYYHQPLDAAKQFEDMGLTRLHLVDLDGAKKGAVVNWKVLTSIVEQTNLIVDFGGGIKTEEDLIQVFNSGAHFATIGSLAVKEDQLFIEWINKYGPNKFLLGADVKGLNIAINGWLQTTDINIFSFIQKYVEVGITQLFCTDISKDGMLEGPSLSLYQRIIAQFPTLFFIASGGVSSLEDLAELKKSGCKAVIVGKAIYENRISLSDLNKFK